MCAPPPRTPAPPPPADAPPRKRPLPAPRPFLNLRVIMRKTAPAHPFTRVATPTTLLARAASPGSMPDTSTRADLTTTGMAESAAITVQRILRGRIARTSLDAGRGRRKSKDGVARMKTYQDGGGVIRIDPTQVAVDVVRGLLQSEASDTTIEVEASKIRVARESEKDRTLKSPKTPNVVNLLQISASVEEELGWTPTPLPDTTGDYRPTPFYKLDGKPDPNVTVPESSLDLTPEWCTVAFRSRGFLTKDEAIKKVSMKPLGAGEGEFSELVLLNIEEVIGGPASSLPRHLVAKFSPPNMSAIEVPLVFGPEAHFYNDFTVAGGGLVRPITIYCGYLKKKGRCTAPSFCIIMESGCPPTKPTRSFKRVTGCDSLEHLHLAMRTLAKFHARWWGLDTNRTPPLDWVSHPDCGGGAFPRLPRSVSHTLFVMVFKHGIKALPHCFSDKAPYGGEGVPKFGEQYALFLSKIRPVARRRRHSIVNMLFRHPLTLTHGDAHLENIFFGEQYPGGCAFIDFGLTAFGNALSDVATVIGGGMPVEARRAHEQTLVKQ